jgi:hypothetical protein
MRIYFSTSFRTIFPFLYFVLPLTDLYSFPQAVGAAVVAAVDLEANRLSI